MYNGPYYFHQPGLNHHKWTVELLQNKIGDGVILPFKTMTRDGLHTNTFVKTIAACRQSDTKILIDTENFDPSVYDGHLPDFDGSKILGDSAFRRSYVESSLVLQHEHFASGYIVPNFEANSISSTWRKNSTSVCHAAQEWIGKNGNSQYPVYLAIAVPAKDIMDRDSCRELLNYLATLKKHVSGFYLNITEVPQILTDTNLLRGILTTVFRLKWQEFQVILGMAGFWVETLFPIGLDCFGNGATKSRQAFNSKRTEDKAKHGFNSEDRPEYYSVFSPATMSYLRYPDDAEFLHAEFTPDEIREIYGAHSGYAPPTQQKPAKVYAAKGYSHNKRLKHVAASMSLIAGNYQIPTLNDRISKVQKSLKKKHDLDVRIGKILGDETRGQDKQVWLTTFNQFIDDNQDDLEDLFD